MLKSHQVRMVGDGATSDVDWHTSSPTKAQNIQAPDEHASAADGGESDKPWQTCFGTTGPRRFSYAEQTRTILPRLLSRWLVTAAIVASILGVLRLYRNKGIISRAEKGTFNGVMTGLTILLGLNFFEAFRALAKNLRWWILAQKEHDLRQVDLILGIDNLRNVFVLAWESKKLWTSFCCVTWVLLNLGAQVAIALTNASYSVDDGKDWNSTYTRDGPVLAPNLTCYFHPGYPGHKNNRRHCPIDSGTPKHLLKAQQVKIQGLANSFGEYAYGSTFSSPCVSYNDISDVLASREKPPYYCRQTPGRQEFTYRFLEFNVDDDLKAYPWLTNRTISASTGQCFSYRETSDWQADRHTFTNGTHNESITIARRYTGVDGTSYLYRGLAIPQLEANESCGPRCLWMWAYRHWGMGKEPTLFRCPVTVYAVKNATEDVHVIPDDIARLAAASIGLRGQFREPVPTWDQFRFYPFGNRWEVHFRDIEDVGANMAEFAINSIASMTLRNPHITIDGTLASLGSQINVDWWRPLALFASIAGAQLAILLSATYVTRLVIVPDDSDLSRARLLRPFMVGLRDSGTLSSAKTLSQSYAGLVYGPRDDGSGFYYLDIASDIRKRENWPGRRHPEGMYC